MQIISIMTQQKLIFIKSGYLIFIRLVCLLIILKEESCYILWIFGCCSYGCPFADYSNFLCTSI